MIPDTLYFCNLCYIKKTIIKFVEQLIELKLFGNSNHRKMNFNEEMNKRKTIIC